MNEQLTQIDDEILDQVSGGQGVSLGGTIPFTTLGGIVSFLGTVMGDLGSFLSSLQGYGLSLGIGIAPTDTTSSST